jgi:hypothetical protein
MQESELDSNTWVPSGGVPSQLSWTLSGVNRLGFGLQVGPAWRFEAQELVQLHVVVAQGPAQVVDLAGEIPLT